jgi:predicted enzyme related to lactoylglutathione lyase
MFTDSSAFFVLYTTKLEATKKFYSNIGVNPIEEEEKKIVLRMGDYELHFVDPESELIESYLYNNENQFGMGYFMYLGTRNINKTYNVIEAAMPNKITSIVNNHWESKEFLFEDINGYKFVVFEDLEF